MDSDNLIFIEEGGELKAFGGEAREALREAVGRYRLIASSPQLMLLRRQPGSQRDVPSTRILMAGEILYSNTVIEVVNVIVASRWAGTLHVFGADTHRILGVDRGALRSARSDHPMDRLNKVLFRLGVVTPTQAEAAERELRSDQRFGEVLVEQGILDRASLYEHLQRQMEEIFFSAVMERDGCYVFSVDEGAAPPPSMMAHLPMQQLLFDAAERLDRLGDYERLIEDDGLCPEVQEGVEVKSLDTRARRVLALCDGTRSVRDIAVETWLGRYLTMGVLYDLLRRDQVRLQAPKRSSEQVAANLVTPFSEALRDIFGTVERCGNLRRTQEELERWIERSEFRQYLEGVLADNGAIASRPVADMLDQLGVRDREEVVQHALHEMVSFALFAAALSLPRDAERDLSRRVNERLQPM